jgi:uncharacterized protein YjiK
MILPLALSFLLNGCAQPPISHFPYQLDQPDQTFELPQSLHEISGLGMGPNGKTLAAVEDETGSLFLLEKTTGRILHEIPFWKDGDYEGVEFVGEEVFVVKSNGNLYQIQNPATEAQIVIKHDSPYKKEYDIEGLALDPSHNRLLLACKGDAGVPNGRAIFSFHLGQLAFDTIPTYTILGDSITAFVQANTELDRWEKLAELFNPDESELAFSPSAIALHPLTGNLYLLSSVGKLLVVLDPASGHVIHIQKLKKSVHAQPEGICFDADGTMFISNEGKDGVAKIHRFNYRPEE